MADPTGSGTAARQRLASIRADLQRLKQYPCLYPIVDHQSVRELPCASGYRALYEVNPDTGRNEDAGDIIVLRVYGPGQSRNGFSSG